MGITIIINHNKDPNLIKQPVFPWKVRDPVFFSLLKLLKMWWISIGKLTEQKSLNQFG